MGKSTAGAYGRYVNISIKDSTCPRTGVPQMRVCYDCNFCVPVYQVTSTIVNPKKTDTNLIYSHMKRKHREEYYRVENPREETALDQMLNVVPLQHKLTWPEQPNASDTTFNDGFEETVLLQVLDNNISFNSLSKETFWGPYLYLFSGHHRFDRKKLAGKVLDRCFDKKKKEVEDKIKKCENLSLYSDAWTAPGRGSLKYINAVLMLSYRDKQSEFIFIDAEIIENFETETGNKVFKFLKKQLVYLHRLGKLTVAICTDNAGVMVKGWKLLEMVESYKNLFYYSCSCHCLNNFLKICVNGASFKRNGVAVMECLYFKDLFVNLKEMSKKLRDRKTFMNGL